MRILINATSLRSTSIGGGETFICGLAEALAGRSHHFVTVVTSRGAFHRMRADLPETVNVVTVPVLTGAGRVVSDGLLLWWWAIRWKADLVVYPHEWTPPCSRPVVLVSQNILWMHPATARSTGVRGGILRWLVRRTAAWGAAWVAVSAEARMLWAAASGISLSRIAVLPEGLREGDVQRARQAAAPSWADGAILAVTGASAHKGRDVLEASIDLARRQNPHLVVHIAGASSSPAEGRRYHGFLDRSELLAAMARSSLVVFPSAVESFGLPAFEAAAVGTPCIVRKGSAMEYWLGDRVMTFDGTASDLSGCLLAPPESTGPDDRFLWSNVIHGWIESLEAAQSAGR